MKNNNSAQKQFVKMTTTPVNKLITSLAVPTVISMLITMIYNVVDTYFVSKISVEASGATGIVFSLMGIIQAFGFMLGNGAGSNISRRLGARDIESARVYCSTAFFIALVFSLVLTVLGLVFITPLVKMMGSTSTILPYAKIYAAYILIAAPAMTTSCVMNNTLRYEGMAKLAMIGLTTGGVLNMVLDPILIFKFNMGVSGAGIATAVSQYISMGILLAVFIAGKTQSKISLKYLSFKQKTSRDIIFTGAPSFARQGLNALSIMVLNICASAYGDICIAAMGIVLKCSNVIFSVCIGIGQGFQPVCSFNYGAEIYSRVRQGVKFLWKLDTIVSAVLSGVVFVLAPQIIAIFRNEPQIIEIGTQALRFMCISLVFLPTVMTANMTFQSIGMAGKAFFLSCTQNGLFFIPVVLVLPKLLGVMGVELSYPIAYVFAAFVSIPFLLSFLNKLRQMTDKELKTGL